MTPHPNPNPNPSPHTLLIGLRASGKSTLAPRLAQQLHQPHADLDQLVCHALNVRSAGEAFRTLGQPAFRAAETQQLKAATDARDPIVLALGGGTPTAPGAPALLNALALERRARIVYLRASPATLAARLHAHDDNRPSLTGAHPAREVARVFQQRDALYRTIATHTINTDPPNDDIDTTLNRLINITTRA